MSKTSSGQTTDMVLVMGVTGAGKSYFINKLKEGAVEEGDGLESKTSTCQVVSAQVGSTGFAIVDCPGFNDTYRSSTEILEEISKVCCTQSVLAKNLRLKGILYLHGIDKARMEGSDVEALQTLQEIVGEAALSHIFLVTSKWGKDPANVAIKRETELRNVFWKRMIEKGSRMARFHGDTSSAQGIVSQLIQMPQVSITLQRELLQENKTLFETSAGGYLALGVGARHENLKKELLELSKRIREEKNGTRQVVLQVDKKKVEAETARILLDKKKLETRVGVETKARVGVVKAIESQSHATYRTPHIHLGRENLQTFCSVLGFGMTVILPAMGMGCLIM